MRLFAQAVIIVLVSRKKHIYPSFKAFLKVNSAWYTKFPISHILKQVWDARESEVDMLAKEYATAHGKYQDKIKDLNTQIIALRRKNDALNKDLPHQKAELSKYKKFSSVLERVLGMGRAQIKKLSKDKEELAHQLKMANATIIKLDEKCEELNNQLTREREYKKGTVVELEATEAQVRTQKRLNNQMERELLRLSDQLKRLEQASIV